MVLSESAFQKRAYSQISLWQLTANSFKRSSLQPEELAAAYSNKNFQQHSYQQESLQQDELTASCFQSPTRATELDSLQQLELSRSIFDDFDQLDQEMSLSFPGLRRTQLQTGSFCSISFEQMELCSLDRFSYQLDLDTSLSFSQFSFQSCSSNSFEQRALHCAALLFRIRLSNNQLQQESVHSFQLTGQQLTGRQFSFGLVSGGAFNRALHTRASPEPLHCPASTLPSLSFTYVKPFCKIALRRSTLSAWTLSSLSFAIIAWLNHARP